MASLTSISLHSTSPLGFASRHDHSSCSMLTVRSFRFTRQGLSSQTVPRGLNIRCAATKQAKSPEVAEVEWKIKREPLLQKKVRSVDAKEALRLQKENNFVILDVRPVKEFNDAHPPNAINAQIYRLIKEWTAWDITRRAAFAFFGIFAGTEENPEFLQTVESNIDKKTDYSGLCSWWHNATNPKSTRRSTIKIIDSSILACLKWLYQCVPPKRGDSILGSRRDCLESDEEDEEPTPRK